MGKIMKRFLILFLLASSINSFAFTAFLTSRPLISPMVATAFGLTTIIATKILADAETSTQKAINQLAPEDIELISKLETKLKVHLCYIEKNTNFQHLRESWRCKPLLMTFGVLTAGLIIVNGVYDFVVAFKNAIKK